MSDTATTVDMTISTGTAAHYQTRTVHIRQYVPHHPTRTDDPYYAIFDSYKRRVKKLGLLKCAVCGEVDTPAKPTELHHTKCEFSMSLGVDVSKFEALHPDLHIASDDDFQKFVEGEGNLTPLCKKHHTGDEGIHVLDYPMWELLSYWKDGLPPPAVAMFGDAVITAGAPTGATVEVAVEVTVDTVGATTVTTESAA